MLALDPRPLGQVLLFSLGGLFLSVLAIVDPSGVIDLSDRLTHGIRNASAHFRGLSRYARALYISSDSPHLRRRARLAGIFFVCLFTALLVELSSRMWR